MGGLDSTKGRCHEVSHSVGFTAASERGVTIQDFFGLACSSISLIILMTYFAGGYLLCGLFIERKSRLSESKIKQDVGEFLELPYGVRDHRRLLEAGRGSADRGYGSDEGFNTFSGYCW